MSDSLKFITFEGGEGCGKTTQIALLAEYFASKNIEFVKTREPGGTDGAEQIRSLLVSGDKDKWHGVTEILLHYAARKEHVEKLVKPSLGSGKVVICDRFFDSTIAYQGYGHNVDFKVIEDIQSATIGDFSPDLTIILSMNPDAGLARAGKRFDDIGDDSEGRYESMGVNFHERVAKGFLEIAAKNPKRCVVIDANDSIENIHKKIIKIIEEKL